MKREKSPFSWFGLQILWPFYIENNNKISFRGNTIRNHSLAIHFTIDRYIILKSGYSTK